MYGEENTNALKSDPLPADIAVEPGLGDLSCEKLKRDIERLQKDLESEEVEEQKLEHVDFTKEELRALPEEALLQQLDLLREKRELYERGRELDRKALNLGLLKLANQAPRCSYLKSNGKACRAPAMGNRQYCVFHTRSIDNQENSGIKIEVLENRESLQLTMKQIMEQIVSGRIEPQNASLLLRAVQIANSTLKAGRVRIARRKPAQSETSDGWGNPEENSG